MKLYIVGCQQLQRSPKRQQHLVSGNDSWNRFVVDAEITFQEN